MSDRKIPQKRKKVCIACGGSAGHIFPGLALAGELVRRRGNNVEISVLTSESELAKSLLEKSGFNFCTLPVQGLRKGTLRENLEFITRLLKGAFESMRIILSSRPDCFIGFGSYVAGPPFMAAFLLGIPTLIHEQNVVTGRANALMRPLATKVTLAFPEYRSARKNVVITGNPIRRAARQVHERKAAAVSLGLARDKFTILVIGGSQGSHAINSIAARSFSDVENRLRSELQVIHISGENDCENVKKAYKDACIANKTFSFLKT